MKSRTISIKKVHLNQKLKSSFFLSDGVISEEIIRSMPHENLIDTVSYCSNIGGVNKRAYVDPFKGMPLISMSDMLMHSPYDSCKYVSRTIGNNTAKHTLRDGMILSSVVGTIGQVAIVNKHSEGCVTGNNIIKLFSERKNYNGFLYAYLKSKYGNSIIKTLGGGSVQSYIDPELFKKIPVPIFSNEKTKEIHFLITKYNEEIENSIEFREKYIDIIEKSLDISIKKQNDHPRSFNLNINKINNNTFCSWSYSPFYETIKSKIKQKEFRPLKDVTIAKGVFLGKMFKRIPSSETKGVELISQRDLVNLRSDGRYISKKSVDDIDDYFVQNGTTLIAAVGATDPSYSFGVGHYVHNNFLDKFINPDTLRIVPDQNKIQAGFLFAFLDSKIGKMLFHSTVYGTKLIRFIPKLLKEIPIWYPENNIREEINELVIKRYDCVNRAIKYEDKAISLIEKEIEKWQK